MIVAVESRSFYFQTIRVIFFVFFAFGKTVPKFCESKICLYNLDFLALASS